MKDICNMFYRLGVLALAAFLCWYFDNAWGCAALVLLFVDSEEE